MWREPLLAGATAIRVIMKARIWPPAARTRAGVLSGGGHGQRVKPHPLFHVAAVGVAGCVPTVGQAKKCTRLAVLF